MESRKTYLLDALAKNEQMPIRTTGAYSFCRNTETSYPEYLSASRRIRQSWKRGTVMDWYSASDHCYLLHTFLTYGKKQAGGG